MKYFKSKTKDKNFFYKKKKKKKKNQKKNVYSGKNYIRT